MLHIINPFLINLFEFHFVSKSPVKFSHNLKDGKEFVVPSFSFVKFRSTNTREKQRKYAFRQDWENLSDTQMVAFIRIPKFATPTNLHNQIKSHS